MPEKGFSFGNLMMVTEIKFSCIYIIESFPSHDPPSGKNLYKHIEALLPKIPGMGLTLFDVDSKKGFIDAIAEIERRLDKRGITPYIHFDMHGMEEGLAFKNDEWISWAEIRPLLVGINFKTKKSLFVSLASCHGGYMVVAVSPIEKAPFYGYIGYAKEISFKQADTDWYNYFTQLFLTKDFYEAVKALNKDNDLPIYVFHSYRTIWEDIKKAWLSKYDTEEKIAFRVEELVQMAKDDGGRLPQSEMENFFRNELEKRHLHLDQLRRHYMHETDVFPKELI
ncbi:MAG: hypothetical protein ABJC98_13760 [Bacteroidota bacterium]